MKKGDAFPPFSLQDQDANIWTNADLLGQKAIIYFYPKDDTSGCTAQACSLRDSLPKFEGIRVFGVSPDSAKSHRKFVDKYGLNFTLLADTDHRLAEALGLWVEKSLYGRKYFGVARTTFVLDADGRIAEVFEKVKPQDHAEFLLTSLVAR